MNQRTHLLAVAGQSVQHDDDGRLQRLDEAALLVFVEMPLTDVQRPPSPCTSSGSSNRQWPVSAWR